MKETHTINIEGLHFNTVIGVRNIDRHKRQDIYLDIMLTYERTNKEDELSATINYADITAIATDYIENNEPQLIETIAEYVADECLKIPEVHEVSVTVKKPQALPNGIPSIVVSKAK